MGELSGERIGGVATSEKTLLMRPEFVLKIKDGRKSVSIKSVIADPAVQAGIDYETAINTAKTLLMESEINRKIACKQCGKCPCTNDKIICPVNTIGNVRSKMWVVGHSPNECCTTISVAFGDGVGIVMRSAIDCFFNETPFYTYVQKCMSYDPIVSEECIANYFVTQVAIGKPSWMIFLGKQVLASLLKNDNVTLTTDYSPDCHAIMIQNHQVLIYEIPEFERVLLGAGGDYQRAVGLFKQTVHNALQTKLS